MYWPIGAPRIFAASNHGAERQVVHSEDGTPEGVTERRGSQSPKTTRHSYFSQDGTESTRAQVPPTTPRIPDVKPVDQDTEEEASEPPVNGSSDDLEDRAAHPDNGPVISIKTSRSGHLFAAITATSLTIWQTKPTAILAVVARSPPSLKTYGENVALLIRPDSAIFVVQTTNGYLITYSLASDPDARVYQPHFSEDASVHTRRQSNFTRNRGQGDRITWGPGEGAGVREVSIRFRMVIKVDAGIAKALALDEELVVATEKPPAIQCIRWTPDGSGNQTSTELLSKMEWLARKSHIAEIIHDRPMNLFTWVTRDGAAYAVQRLSDQASQKESEETKPMPTKKLFRGYCFHTPESPEQYASKAAVNARFSLIAVGCAGGKIQVYTARDYVGNIPFSHQHQLSVSSRTSGRLTFLSYSPDGYCLFAGYEHGWATWSVFGKPGATSFVADKAISEANGEEWLNGVHEGMWLSGGSEILLVNNSDCRIWVLEFARSALTGCFTPANVSRTMLQTRTGIMVYRGYDLPDLTTISGDASLWHTAHIPPSYLVDQFPIRSAVVSPDGRYVAVAGRRGLAHYSVHSGRWKTFVNEAQQNEFQVRGGMCWHQHILVAAVEAADSYELRLYSRETPLDTSVALHIEKLPAPVVLLSPSGDDSLLVYTYDNLLYHYIFTIGSGSVNLVQVGQIGFHGIVRSPARVRGLSWILPEEQLQNGDPSQDVAVATVLFLVDGKLVSLQPSMNDKGNLKYDMRVIAQNVEYYAMMRDHAFLNTSQQELVQSPLSPGSGSSAHSLRDSLWMFDGIEMRLWPDVRDVLRSSPNHNGRELPPTIGVSVDFYPLSALLLKGILLGVESDLIQRRDMGFAFFRNPIRTHLFIPQLLRYYLSQHDVSTALRLAHSYQDLEYFAHALEVLLHNVLDEEVDSSPPPEMALLPRVLSFLSSFPQYLDVVVQCTRKTEVRSWRTLFSYLPPPGELFEESLQRGSLKTAGGYLLVLHTFEELSSSSEQLVRLLARAKSEGDWELCKELARFLAALDETGNSLREALEMADLRSAQEDSNGAGSSFLFGGTGSLQVPQAGKARSYPGSSNGYDRHSRSSSQSPRSSPRTVEQTGEGAMAEGYFTGVP